MCSSLGSSQWIITPQADLLDDVVTFQTKRFQDIYFAHLEGRTTSVATRISLLREVLKEEQKWIESMGQEYDEIIKAQEIMDQLKT